MNISKHFLQFILREIIFFKHAEATCQRRRLMSVFQFSEEIFMAVLSAPSMCRLVLSRVETHSERVVLKLRPTSVRRCPTRAAWAPHLPQLLPCRWVTRNCWGTAEPECEKRLSRKKYTGDIDFRKGSANAAESQMCDHIYTCEIVPVSLKKKKKKVE